MTFRQCLTFIGLTTALAWTAWGLVLWRLNPDEVGWPALALFFLTLFLSLVGTFSTISLSYRVIKQQRPVISREARIAFRQALLLASGCCLMLFLASRDLLKFWIFLMTFLVFGGIEFLALRSDKRQRA